MTNAANQHERLRESFLEQTCLDLQRLWPDVAEPERNRAAELALRVLVDLFSERGVELVNAALAGAEVAGRRSPSLFALLSRAGQELDTDETRYRFVSYVADFLAQPSAEQRAYLEHLALAFFSLSALAMDPDGQRFKHEYLSGRALVCDSNILIPLLPKGATFQNDFGSLISASREATIPLFTTDGFIEELHRHGTWALQLVEKFGPQSVPVLQAARGDGFRRNAFLDGFVRYSVDVRTIAFADYLSECIGGQPFTRPNLVEYLKGHFGISRLEFDTLTRHDQNAFVDRDETVEFIQREAEARDIDKSESRARAEAEAYHLVKGWNVVVDASSDSKDSALPTDLAVLSQGGYLNRVARAGPHAVGKYIVVPPEALYGFLIRTGFKTTQTMSFRELMMSSVFDTTLHFIDKRKYQAFFANLINEAERVYRENLEAFQPGRLDLAARVLRRP